MNPTNSISKQVFQLLIAALIICLLLMQYSCSPVRGYTITDVNDNGHVKFNGSKHWFIVADTARLQKGATIKVKRNTKHVATIKRID
jgi:membrane-bound ClpP family serine protease